MKKTVLITGASGMLAKRLADLLAENYSIRFLTRKVKKDNEFLWDINKKYIDPKALHGVDIVIHLAGAPIAAKRWTKARKKVIVSSRIDSAELLLTELKNQNIVLDTYISASAVGYYGTLTTKSIYNEHNPKGNDFLSTVCQQWEEVAHRFKSENVAKKVAITRIGVILAKDDGALKKIATPIKLGIGAPMGTGKQYMPWIHINDLTNMIRFIIETDGVEGIFNAVSPEHISNKQLTQKIANRLNRKLFLPNIPKFVMKLILGDMASMLLEGSRVSSKKIMDHGFTFQHPNINEALKDGLQ